jgi:hypothetical protein
MKSVSPVDYARLQIRLVSKITSMPSILKNVSVSRRTSHWRNKANGGYIKRRMSFLYDTVLKSISPWRNKVNRDGVTWWIPSSMTRCQGAHFSDVRRLIELTSHEGGSFVRQHLSLVQQHVILLRILFSFFLFLYLSFSLFLSLSSCSIIYIQLIGEILRRRYRVKSSNMHHELVCICCI